MKHFCLGIQSVWLAASFSTIAQEKPDWFIKPTVCVVKKHGDLCHLDIEVELSGSWPEDVCFLFQEEDLGCWATKEKIIHLALLYKEDAPLIALSDQGAEIMQEAIEIKALTRVRRRVRAPWSLF